MTTSLRIKTFTLGSWMTSCYLVRAGDSPSCWVIDAGFEPGEMIKYMKLEVLSCEKLILTHSHLDHIAGVEDFLSEWPDAAVLIHEAEADFLTDPAKNLSSLAGMTVTAPPATGTLAHGQELNLGDTGFTVFHTPGHSPGGICLYSKAGGVLFAGDTIFRGSVGRYDFPTSDGEALFAAISGYILSLPDETRIFPGHGPSTTVGEERSTNPFLKGVYT